MLHADCEDHMKNIVRYIEDERRPAVSNKCSQKQRQSEGTQDAGIGSNQ